MIRGLDIPVIRALDIPVIRALVYRPSAPAEVFQVQTRATSKRDANILQEEWREAEIPNQIIAAATECNESDETSMPTTESDSDENDPTQLELDEYWLHQERTDRSVLTPEERLERKHEELSRKKQPDRDQLVSEQYQDTTEHSDEEEDKEAMLETWKQLHTEGEIGLEPGTSLEQAAELKNLVDAFRKSVCSSRTKQTPFTELQIRTKDAQPIHLPPYRMPRVRHECVQTEVKKMLEADLIRPSTSPWASPIILVPKKDGSWRSCVNYLKLNAVTEADPFPIPRVDDLLEQLVHAKYLTTLDLLKGYWQVPVSESSQPKTAFVTPFGKYEFKVMPFGLVGAPATFQRLMNEILSPVKEFSIAYMDDICIFSASWTEHLKHLRKIFQLLEDAGLTVNLKKCRLGRTSVTYLGHTVGAAGIRPEEAKVKAVRDHPRPTTKRDFRAFIGLTSYYRRFIPKFAEIAVPLTNLTRKTEPDRIVWSQELEESFQKLKDSLCADPVLMGPDYSKMFYLQTDASKTGISGVLRQKGEDGHDRPIAYFSR